jgi:hypothetical protein
LRCVASRRVRGTVALVRNPGACGAIFQAFATNNGIRFFETSARTDYGVEEAFLGIGRDIRSRCVSVPSVRVRVGRETFVFYLLRAGCTPRRWREAVRRALPLALASTSARGALCAPGAVSDGVE